MVPIENMYALPGIEFPSSVKITEILGEITGFITPT
jgi:hypothetical protein